MRAERVGGLRPLETRVRLLLPGSRQHAALSAALGGLREYDPPTRPSWAVVPCQLGPDCDEWGYASLHEVGALRVPPGLPPERDLEFTPAPLTRVRAEH